MISNQEVWYKPSLSYKPTHKMGMACRTWCKALGLDPAFNSSDWKTVASIIRNLNDLQYSDTWLIIQRGYPLTPAEDFAGLSHNTKILFLDYLVNKGVLEERIGYTDVASTYRIKDSVLWNIEKGVILSDSFSEVNNLSGNSIIKNKKAGERKTLSIRLDKANTKILTSINKSLRQMIESVVLDPTGFNWDKINELKLEDNKEYKLKVESLSNWLARSTRWYPGTLSAPWACYTTSTNTQLENTALESHFEAIFEQIIGGISLAMTTCELFQVQIARYEPDSRGRERWVNKGGRLYHDLLGLPSLFRSGLRINGKSLAEIDIKASHIYQAYAEMGLEFDGDYNLPRFSEEENKYYRKLIKSAILTSLNCKSEADAISSVQKNINFGEYPPLPIGMKVSDLIQEIKTRYAAISKLLFADRGVSYMGADGELCLAVYQWAIENKIIVVAIHDGFLVHHDKLGDVETYISHWCYTRFGHQPRLEQKL